MTTLMTSVKNKNLIKKNTIEFPQEIWSIIKSYLKPPSSGDAFTISYNLFLQEHHILIQKINGILVKIHTLILILYKWDI